MSRDRPPLRSDDDARRPNVTFRGLTDDDLTMLHRWLNDPGVVRWWEGDNVSWDAVVRDYGSTNDEPVEHWIAAADGQDVGWSAFPRLHSGHALGAGAQSTRPGLSRRPASG